MPLGVINPPSPGIAGPAGAASRTSGCPGTGWPGIGWAGVGNAGAVAARLGVFEPFDVLEPFDVFESAAGGAWGWPKLVLGSGGLDCWAEAAEIEQPRSANVPAIARQLGAVHRNMIELLFQKKRDRARDCKLPRHPLTC
jgi:hypothetical protein